MKTTAFAILALAAGAHGASHSGGGDKKEAKPSPFKKADGVLAGTYPATFPSQNDIFQSVEKIPGYNNIKDGITDVTAKAEDGETYTHDFGGHAAASWEYCNPFDIHPFGTFVGGVPGLETECGRVFQRGFIMFFGMGWGELAGFNCTAAGVIMEGPHSGTFSGAEQACDGADCCTEYHGHPHLSTEWLSQQKKWDERYNKFGCSFLDHPMYCFVLFYNNNWCNEHWAYASENTVAPNTQLRTVIMPCANYFDYFLNQCSTLKALGAKSLLVGLSVEPEVYTDTLTAQESNTALTVFYANDHVCHSMAESNPAKFKTEASPPAAGEEPSSGGEDAPTAGGSTINSASTDKDGVSAVKAPIALFSSILAVFTFARFL